MVSSLIQTGHASEGNFTVSYYTASYFAPILVSVPFNSRPILA